MKTQIKFTRSNEINDIFSFIDENNEIDYISFPRTMDINIEDVINYLNNK